MNGPRGQERRSGIFSERSELFILQRLQAFLMYFSLLFLIINEGIGNVMQSSGWTIFSAFLLLSGAVSNVLLLINVLIGGASVVY